ncbi:hypothetical protein BDK51DRAFT_51942 [Blyttiomyces helicus]|uniref:Uncharacterized protein n=1 Tax=Blyttiomyces helicus TaxID=388810 RepID=A0A4P9W8L3_9FUNG|nr:hypothetical protein BDK51DRAFT_51942 [Blyttiomyces helicus]|eukprot:RKO88694.1 hypothetical protein BDK51DRAFT_51942 [Blyttiomyces helicus]
MLHLYAHVQANLNRPFQPVQAQRNVVEKRSELAPIEGRTSALRAQVESLVSERERLRTYIDETHHRATQLAAALSAHRYREEAAARDLAALLDVFRLRSSALLELVEALEGECADVDRIEAAVKVVEAASMSSTEYRDTIDEKDDNVSRLANRLRSSDLTVAELEREADRLEKYVLSVPFLFIVLESNRTRLIAFVIGPGELWDNFGTVDFSNKGVCIGLQPSCSFTTSTWTFGKVEFSNKGEVPPGPLSRQGYPLSSMRRQMKLAPNPISGYNNPSSAERPDQPAISDQHRFTP